VGRKIVEHDADPVRMGIMRIDEIAHAMSKILRSSVIRDLHVTPGFMRIEKHEQISRAVAPIFAIIALQPPWRGRDRQPNLTNHCVGLSSKQMTGRF